MFDCLELESRMLPVVKPPKNNLAQRHVLRRFIAVQDCTATFTTITVLVFARTNNHEFGIAMVIVVGINKLEILKVVMSLRLVLALLITTRKT